MTGGSDNPLRGELASAVDRLRDRVAANTKASRGSRPWGPLYTMVFWPVLDEFELSRSEYDLADAIEKLSRNYAPIPGWCNASKATLAKLTRVSEASLYRSLKALREKGLVEENGERKDLLRTTEKWGKAVELCQRRLKH